MIETRSENGLGFYRQCGHPAHGVRKFTASNGVVHFRKQCLTCGGNLGNVGKRAMWNVPGPVDAWDEELPLRYWKREQERRRVQYETARQERSEAWWRWYNEYLESPEWRARRLRVFERDRYLCRAGFPAVCTERATQVHHLSYNHVGDEALFELIAICHECHEHITRADRAKRDGTDSV